MKIQVKETRKLINDLVRIEVLEEELAYYRTLIQTHDTGHIHTTIHFIEDRVRILKGGKPEWPFV